MKRNFTKEELLERLAGSPVFIRGVVVEPATGLLIGTSTWLCKRYGMTPTVVYNWQKRYRDFPTAHPDYISSHRMPCFYVAEVDLWVESYRADAIAKLPTVPSRSEIELLEKLRESECGETVAPSPVVE
jgi:hypothetical protein